MSRARELIEMVFMGAEGALFFACGFCAGGALWSVARGEADAVLWIVAAAAFWNCARFGFHDDEGGEA